MPTISVIVPVYRVEPYLRRCADSILAQTYTDFELILVDDGSPDACGAVCDEYAVRDARVHVIHQPNRGLSAARNAGIDWASANSDSQWISFVDSDDWVHPQYLERLLDALDGDEADASACLFSCLQDGEAAPDPGSGEKRSFCFEEYFCHEEMGHQAVVAWGKLYRKSLFALIRYPIGRINEDLFTTHKILADSRKIVLVRARLYYYYQSGLSIMRSPWNPGKLDEIQASEELIQFMQEKGFRRGYARAVQMYRWILERQLRAIKALDKKDSCHTALLRQKARRLLLGNGCLLPFSQNTSLYELAFPKLMWCYWTGVGILGKLKRKLKK